MIEVPVRQDEKEVASFGFIRGSVRPFDRASSQVFWSDYTNFGMSPKLVEVEPSRKAFKLFLEGRVSNFPLGYLRTFCPRKSKPSGTCVVTVFSGESSSPRFRRNFRMPGSRGAIGGGVPYGRFSDGLHIPNSGEPGFAIQT